MRHHPDGLLGGQRCPGALDKPGAQFQGTDRVTTLRGAIETALDPHRSCRTVVGRCTPQDAMVALPVDLDRWHIEIEASQCVAQRFALSRDKEPMQLLCKRVEVLHGLTRCSTLPQKVLQLIHSRGLTGQQGTALQCVHGGSPLVEVVHVTTPVFQSGDAPSSGPHRLPRSRAQTASTFLHQYVIYTHVAYLLP